MKASIEVTALYEGNASPGNGTFICQEGFQKEHFPDEYRMAVWIYETFGGDITVLRISNKDKIKTPDYQWNGKFWDLKMPTTEAAARDAIDRGMKQIKDNPGGLILNYEQNKVSVDRVREIVDRKMFYYHTADDIDIIIVKGRQYWAYQYKK